MEKILDAMERRPGRAVVTILAINIVIFLGSITAIAVAVRYALTGHIG